MVITVKENRKVRGIRYVSSNGNMLAALYKVSWGPDSWLGWLDHCPIHQKVAGLIASQGTYLGLQVQSPIPR